MPSSGVGADVLVEVGGGAFNDGQRRCVWLWLMLMMLMLMMLMLMMLMLNVMLVPVMVPVSVMVQPRGGESGASEYNGPAAAASICGTVTAEHGANAANLDDPAVAAASASASPPCCC